MRPADAREVAELRAAVERMHTESRDMIAAAYLVGVTCAAALLLLFLVTTP